jgi:hypothetical protein
MESMIADFNKQYILKVRLAHPLTAAFAVGLGLALALAYLSSLYIPLVCPANLTSAFALVFLKQSALL